MKNNKDGVYPEYPLYHDLILDYLSCTIADEINANIPSEFQGYSNEEGIKHFEEGKSFYNINSMYIDSVFGHKTATAGPDNFFGIMHEGKIIDEETFYRVNSDGLRSNEFSKNKKIVVAGCSHTYGTGLLEELRWGNQLSDLTGIDIDNVSYAGASVMHIIENLFKYFNKYGNPEYLLCFFPDFYRIKLAHNENVFIRKDTLKKIKEIERYYEADTYVWVKPDIRNHDKKYLKLPIDPGDIIPPEVGYSLNMQYIKMLIQYCKSSGIKLIWTSWSHKISYVLEKIQEMYPDDYDTYVNFKFIEKFHIPASSMNCHENIKAKNEKYFYHARDFMDSPNLYPHWGSHMHAHIAEEFLAEMKKRYDF